MQDFFSDLPLMIGAISIVFLLLWWGINRWLFGDSKANKLGRSLPGNITNPEPEADALSGFAGTSAGRVRSPGALIREDGDEADQPDSIDFRPIGKTTQGDSVPPLIRTDIAATTARASRHRGPALVQHRLPGTSIVNRNLKSQFTARPDNASVEQITATDRQADQNESSTEKPQAGGRNRADGQPDSPVNETAGNQSPARPQPDAEQASNQNPASSHSTGSPTAIATDPSHTSQSQSPTTSLLRNRRGDGVGLSPTSSTARDKDQSRSLGGATSDAQSDTDNPVKSAVDSDASHRSNNDSDDSPSSEKPSGITNQRGQGPSSTVAQPVSEQAHAGISIAGPASGNSSEDSASSATADGKHEAIAAARPSTSDAHNGRAEDTGKVTSDDENPAALNPLEPIHSHARSQLSQTPVDPAALSPGNTAAGSEKSAASSGIVDHPGFGGDTGEPATGNGSHSANRDTAQSTSASNHSAGATPTSAGADARQHDSRGPNASADNARLDTQESRATGDGPTDSRGPGEQATGSSENKAETSNDTAAKPGSTTTGLQSRAGGAIAQSAHVDSVNRAALETSSAGSTAQSNNAESLSTGAVGPESTSTGNPENEPTSDNKSAAARPDTQAGPDTLTDQSASPTPGLFSRAREAIAARTSADTQNSDGNALMSSAGSTAQRNNAASQSTAAVDPGSNVTDNRDNEPASDNKTATTGHDAEASVDTPTSKKASTTPGIFTRARDAIAARTSADTKSRLGNGLISGMGSNRPESHTAIASEQGASKTGHRENHPGTDTNENRTAPPAPDTGDNRTDTGNAATGPGNPATNQGDSNSPGTNQTPTAKGLDDQASTTDTTSTDRPLTDRDGQVVQQSNATTTGAAEPGTAHSNTDEAAPDESSARASDEQTADPRGNDVAATRTSDGDELTDAASNPAKQPTSKSDLAPGRHLPDDTSDAGTANVTDSSSADHRDLTGNVAAAGPNRDAPVATKKRWYNPFASVFKPQLTASDVDDANRESTAGNADTNIVTLAQTPVEPESTASLQDIVDQNHKNSTGSHEDHAAANAHDANNLAQSRSAHDNPDAGQTDNNNGTDAPQSEQADADAPYKIAAKSSVPSPTSEARLHIPVDEFQSSNGGAVESTLQPESASAGELTAVLEIPTSEFPPRDPGDSVNDVLDSKDYMIARLQARIKELESVAEPDDYRQQIAQSESQLAQSKARITGLQNQLLKAHQQRGATVGEGNGVSHNRPTLLSKIKLQSGQRN